MDRGTAAILASRRPAPVTGAPAPRPKCGQTGHDAGTAAILASRAPVELRVRVADVHVGFVGNPYSDATHELMTQNRDRVYQSNPPLPLEKLAEWEKLWAFWLPFYSSLVKAPDPDGWDSPQREMWFREQATTWKGYLDSREPRKFESGSPWPFILGGVAFVGLIAGVAGAARGV